jgi:hypothetical protein
MEARGLADGFGVSRIVLVAFHIRLDVAGRHQTHVMPATSDLARPEVRSAAGLNANNTGWQSGKEARDLAPTQPSAQNDSPEPVNPVELENMLREIDPDGANLAHGWLLSLVISTTTILALRCREGAIHPISLNCNSR